MPGLFLHRSNLIENLSCSLSEYLKKNPLQDPLQPEYVVVSSRGMEQWIKRRLSEDIGVCSNVLFPFPTELLSQALAKLTTDLHHEYANAWSPDSLIWAVIKSLPALISQESFKPLFEYLSLDSERKKEKSPNKPQNLESDLCQCITHKELSLAKQIANIFDKYVTFRPEWAVNWSIGNPITDDTLDSHQWQPILWQAIEKLSGPNQAHIATRLLQLNPACIDNAPAKLGYSRLSFFGISSLPRVYMELLCRLSQLIEVHLFILCPSDQYWGDLKNVYEKAKQHHNDREVFADFLRENRDSQEKKQQEDQSPPLLLSWGRVARDFQTVLLDIDPGPNYLIECTEIDHFIDPSSPPALARIQSDIFNMRGPKPEPLSFNDDSIQLHSCHSPTRQVEVLRDILYHLFERHSHLQPRDIVVMTPDIEAYAPLVSAIFSEGLSKPSSGGWGTPGGPQIPFRLASLSLRRLNPVADAMMRVLEMVTGRVEASTVLDFLTLEPVQRRFGFTPEDLPTLQHWIETSQIRWGINDLHRHKQHNQPKDIINTWQFGLEQFALGVVMADEGQVVPTLEPSIDDANLNRGVIPYDDMEGQDIELLGRFMEFASSLFYQIDCLGEACSIADWVQRLHQLVEAITSMSGKGAFLTRRVLEVITSLEEEVRRVNCDTPITIKALKQYLEGRLEVAETSQHQNTGAVTFSNLQSMSSIPFKVVILMGMDDNQFPRNPINPRFDLSTRPRRVGDKDPRDEDRMLLLEALLSAREHFIVLYTGRNVRTNKTQDPATPISEFIDVLDLSFEPVGGEKKTGHEEKASDFLTTQHPLQPFSPENYRSKPTHIAAFRTESPDSSLVPINCQDKPTTHLGATPAKSPGSTPFSFNRIHLEGAKSLGQERVQPSKFFSQDLSNIEIPAHIHLDPLVQFIRQPVRYLFKRTMNLNFDESHQLLADREPIEMDSLDKWLIADTLLDTIIKNPKRIRAEILNRLRSTGTLPLGYPGQLLFEKQYQAMIKGKKILDQITGGAFKDPTLPIEIKLPFKGGLIDLSGHLSQKWDNQLIYLFNGKESPKRFLKPWIDYLAWTAQAPEAVNKTYIIQANWDEKIGKPDIQTFSLSISGTHQERQNFAKQELENMINWFIEGQKRRLNLVEKTSFAFAKSIEKLRLKEEKTSSEFYLTWDDFEKGYPTGISDEQRKILIKSMYQAGSAWQRYNYDTNTFVGEFADPHLAIIWSNHNLTPYTPKEPCQEINPRFAWHALRLWQPLLQALQEEGLNP